MLSRTVRAMLAEGALAEGLLALQTRYADLEIGSYPSFRLGERPSVAIVLRGTDKARLAAATDELKALMRDFGAEPEGEGVA
jgi:molybdopterin-biosynthesis enzyme MoeA-like protein